MAAEQQQLTAAIIGQDNSSSAAEGNLERDRPVPRPVVLDGGPRRGLRLALPPPDVDGGPAVIAERQGGSLIRLLRACSWIAE